MRERGGEGERERERREGGGGRREEGDTLVNPEYFSPLKSGQRKEQ